MRPLDDLQRSTGLDEEDERLLHALWPLVEPRLGELVEGFQERLLPGSGKPSERRLHLRSGEVLPGYIRSLLLEHHDERFWEERSAEGERFLDLGLPVHRAFMATAYLRERLCELAQELPDPEQARLTTRAVNRVIDLDLAVFTTSFMKRHEDHELRALQDVIVRNLPVTVLCLDDRGTVTAATRPSARLFGESARLGRHYETFLPPELVEAADLPSLVGRALATGEEVTVPHVSQGHGPRTRHFRFHIVPLHHELARILLHVEELTDVVEAETRALQAEALARLGSLAANVAHEIRNPLTAISTTLQVIRGSFPAGDRRREVLEKLQSQVLRLDRLVSDLLLYARPPAPRLGRVPLAEAAREASVAAAVDAELELAPGPAPEALADPQLLQQVLVNLLQNARDAAGPGGRVRLVVGPGPRVAVQDDGPGVDPWVLERLFTPFVTTKARGTGLGLAISRKLAEAMDAELELDEEPAPGLGGASFILSLASPQGPAGGRASAGGSERRSG